MNAIMMSMKLFTFLGLLLVLFLASVHVHSQQALLASSPKGCCEKYFPEGPNIPGTPCLPDQLACTWHHRLLPIRSLERLCAVMTIDPSKSSGTTVPPWWVAS